MVALQAADTDFALVAGDVENFYPFEGKLTEIRCRLSGHLQTEPLLGNSFTIF